MVELEQIDGCTFVVTDPRFAAPSEPRLPSGRLLANWDSLMTPVAFVGLRAVLGQVAHVVRAASQRLSH